MNLKAILAGEEQKWRRRYKALSANEKHKFYYLREFIQFCLKEGIDDTEKIDNKVYSNYVRYLKHAKNNNERTRLDKCYVVKKLPLVSSTWSLHCQGQKVCILSYAQKTRLFIPHAYL